MPVGKKIVALTVKGNREITMPSEWVKHVQSVYKSKKSKDSSYSYKQAMKDATKTYKRKASSTAAPKKKRRVRKKKVEEEEEPTSPEEEEEKAPRKRRGKKKAQ